MLTAAEISLLPRLDPLRREWTVLDWRDAGRLSTVFVRAWSAAGLVCRPVSEETLSPPELLEMLDGTGPLVVVGSTPLPEALIGVLSGLPGTHIVQQRGERLYQGNRPLADLEPLEVRSGHTSIVLRGRNQAMRSSADLPMVFRARPCSVPGRSIVRVEGSNPFETMPAPRWFRIHGRGSVEMVIDIRPVREGRDRWEVTCNGQSAVLAGQPAEEQSIRLQQLGLVVDRTCPDRDAWGAARRLLANPFSFREVEEGVQPTDFNRSIRSGLMQSLAALPEAHALRIHGAWFADRHEHGVALIEGMDEIQGMVPQTLTGDLGMRAADELSDVLQRCTYCPGLDLWDPLEEGLRIVAEPMLREPRSGMGILVVGNSPPNLPLDGRSPFYDLLEFRGFGSTARRRNSLFTSLVRDLDTQGIPIVYLFLTHDRCGDGEVSALHIYQSLQEQVRQALSQYMRVVAVPADAEGVTRGPGEALACLSMPGVSGVVVSLDRI